jgi:aldose 1-epimerase
MARIVLSGHGYWLALNPDYGANLTGMTWLGPSNRATAILRTCADDALLPGMASPVGCFPMAPFANRIDGGIFPFAGRIHALPINRPDENVAIHGLSRFESFETVSHTDSTIGLLHRYRGDVFAYDLLQEVKIDPSGVSIRLTIVNTGQPMPFGIGLHPYFVREVDARLRFDAAVMSQTEERHLPDHFVAARLGPGFSSGTCLEGLNGFDAHFAGWRPQRAVLDRPEAGVAVTVSASGVLSNLHVYVPPEGGLVCIEPVSHVPDVHNRTALATFGDLNILEPKAVLSGSMHLNVSSL